MSPANRSSPSMTFLKLTVSASPISPDHAARILEGIAQEIRDMERLSNKEMPYWATVAGSVSYQWRLEAAS